MITVLWVMTVAAVVATAGALSGRNAVNATSNRVHLARLFWTASGCAARAHAAIDSVLAATTTFAAAADKWRVLDRAVPPDTACVVSLEAAGTRLDMNDASEEMLQRLFTAMGYADDAPLLTAALADWRDSDAVERPQGAERDWYAMARREVPRDGPLADIRELSRVRGFDNLSAFAAVLTTEPGRVSLATASVNVLLAVPGITRETADRIVAMRDAGTPVPEVMSVLGLVSRSSADSLLGRFPDVVRATTPDPEAWLLTVRATVGVPAVSVTLTRRLLRAGKRAVVASSRSDV
jgi:type II secretory pathway component PulK